MVNMLLIVQDAITDPVVAKNINSLLGAAAAEAIARQPEAANEIRGAALLIAVLLEGATIIALVFALLFKFL